MKNYLEKIIHGTNDFPFSDYSYKDIATPRMVTPLHWHSEIEMLFVEEGTIKTQIEQESYELNAGDILFVNSKELHAVFVTGVPCSYHAFVFGEHFCRFSKEHFFTKDFVIPLFDGSALLPRSIPKTNSDYAFVLDRFKALAKYTENITENRISILFHILELLSLLNKHYVVSLQRDTTEIHKCIDYLEEHYAKPIQLKDVASLVHMTPSYFCTYFKKITGYSPFEQLNLIRINHATFLLREKNKKITTIASECGFNSISFFNRKFHEIMGMSPRQYQKSV